MRSFLNHFTFFNICIKACCLNTCFIIKYLLFHKKITKRFRLLLVRRNLCLKFESYTLSFAFASHFCTEKIKPFLPEPNSFSVYVSGIHPSLSNFRATSKLWNCFPKCSWDAVECICILIFLLERKCSQKQHQYVIR